MAEQTILGTDLVRDALLDKTNDNVSELYTDTSSVTVEVEDARRGEATLLAKITLMDTGIEAATTGSGVLVSASDTTLGFLSTKIDTTSITATIQNPGGNESILFDGSLEHDLTPSLSANLIGGGYELLNTTIGVNNLGSVATTQNFDLSVGNVFSLKPTADISVTFSNVPASVTVWFAEIEGGGDYTFTWPVSVVWDNDAEPDWSLGTNKSIAQFYTRDSGTTVYGRMAWEDLI